MRSTLGMPSAAWPLVILVFVTVRACSGCSRGEGEEAATEEMRGLRHGQHHAWQRHRLRSVEARSQHSRHVSCPPRLCRQRL